jgi:hypothetical protein
VFDAAALVAVAIGGGTDFYGVTAQVLPVLFVILSVEFPGVGYLPDSLTEVSNLPPGRKPGRFALAVKRQHRELMTEAIYTTMMMVMLVLGEVTSLAAIQSQTDTLATRLIVWASLGSGAAATIFPLLAEQYRAVYDLKNPPRETNGLVARSQGRLTRPRLVRIEGVVIAVIITPIITCVSVLLTLGDV